MFRVKFIVASLILFFLALPPSSIAGVEGSIQGTVRDTQGALVPNANIKVKSTNGQVLTAQTSATGEFTLMPVVFGDYSLEVNAAVFAPYQTAVHVASGAVTVVEITLAPAAAGKEILVRVKAKKRLVQNSASVSSSEINKDEIAKMPQGDSISLPKLLTSTTPGAVPGPFGQIFFRGNHANIQYQIDGVQLPDSPSNTFGQAFSPRNIDHMEVITGGVPAEYGERLAAVVNIVTKGGPVAPTGEAEVNYGSYNTFSPYALYGGSNESGSVHYFLSTSYSRTDRGLDTPEPATEANQSQGGRDAIHDQAKSHSEFAKVDWLPNNEDKFSLIFFNAHNSYQIPNYPKNGFNVNDPFFSQNNYIDNFGNGALSPGATPATTFNFVPYNTNDTQTEDNAYAQFVWKHKFSDRAFLQIAPYYKYSQINIGNDPLNDLATSASGATPITTGTPSPSSFAEMRHINNYGVKADYTLREDEKNLLKMGSQLQASKAQGNISIQTDLATAPVQDSAPDEGYFESAYIQDDYSISKKLIMNVGVRFDATQFSFAGQKPSDYAFQPRFGLNYLASETTKLHAFYGKLFQPAPVENLRDTFINSGAGQLSPYDIKAEKDDYFEVGVAQQFLEKHVALLNIYYKSAVNMLDDTQLLNSSAAQPYNFSVGYAYGLEFSVKGALGDDWSDFLNYSYEQAKGKGVSGGIFAFPAGQLPSSDYQYLDHVQIHTANAGLTYSHEHFWATTQGLYGSGLRTGTNNTLHLPGHFTADLTVGYEFSGQNWWSKVKLSGDVLNVFDNAYPITVANGYNGSHYAAGREFFLRLTKEL